MPSKKKKALSGASAAEDAPSTASVPFKTGGFSTRLVSKNQRNKGLKKLLSTLQQKRYHPSAATYVNVAAPPSLIPAKKYCDITGLPAKYTDPNTKLRFHSKEQYAIISQLTMEQNANLLALRGAKTPGL